jgi:hypothetical protein
MAQEDSAGFVHSAMERTVAVPELVRPTMERTIAQLEMLTPNDAGIELEEFNHLARANIGQKEPMADDFDIESEEITPNGRMNKQKMKAISSEKSKSLSDKSV